MKVISRTGREDLAIVYIAEGDGGKRVEFVESLSPPQPREKKWVLVVSTLFGCPVGCRFCDAGGRYMGKLSVDEILFQIDHPVGLRFPDGNVGVEKFKIQFARMGDPALNPHLPDALEALPGRYRAPGLLPSLSTIAPAGRDRFFERLLEIRDCHYRGGFQFQYSIHTTDPRLRRWLIPAKTWDFERMAEYGETFYRKGDRKITLNFALADGMPVHPGTLLRHFDPGIFAVKITPVNPTYTAERNRITSALTPDGRGCGVADSLSAAGYDVIMSIGEVEENHIGSNCGQYLMAHCEAEEALDSGYGYAPGAR